MRRFALLACCLPAIACGCATGGMLSDLSDVPLPLEEPQSPYPTAIQVSVPDGGALTQSASPKPIADSLPQANPQETAPPQAEPAAPSPPTSEPAQPPVSPASPMAPDQAASPPAAETPQPASVQPINLSPEERQAAIAQQRDVLIAMVQEDIEMRRTSAASGNDEQLPQFEQHLRLLYAAAGRPADAARPIDSLPTAERAAYGRLMAGLTTWLDKQPARSPLQAAQVLQSMHEATTELAAISKLQVQNAAFCERVESFGWYTAFARNEFQPKQQVILYVEVEHFTAEKNGPHAFETELQGHYQIFDSRGQIVAERKLPLDREVCRNLRRDYFLAYPIYMPETIEPGRYRLELTVEDLKAGQEYQGRKLGVASVDFAIRS